jgi:hypothetical protein
MRGCDQSEGSVQSVYEQTRQWVELVGRALLTQMRETCLVGDLGRAEVVAAKPVVERVPAQQGNHVVAGRWNVVGENVQLVMN